MPTELRILGWESTGLRCPDHAVQFVDGDDSTTHPITLIQMPTGTGKTTTLILLRAALSGSAEQWDSRKVTSLRKKDGGGDSGAFRVSLLVDRRRVTIVMQFDFAEGIVSYSTTVQSGIKSGFEPPREVARFLRPEFINFFVFDGELAEQLLSHDHTDAQAAIDDLFQLRVFADMKARVQDFWGEVIAGKSATKSKGLNRRRNRVKLLSKRIRELDAIRAKVETEHRQAKRRLDTKNTQFREEINKQKAQSVRVREADAQLQDAEHIVENLSRDILLDMRDPHALSSSFALGVVDLKNNLDRVKLPESAAREFFMELAQEDECVCGRSLDEATRKVVRERAERYLGSEDVILLNAIKSDISSLIGEDLASHEAALACSIEKLVDAIDEAERLRTKRDAVIGDAASGDPKLEQAMDDIKTLEEEVKNLEDCLERYDDTTSNLNDEQTFGIGVLETRLKFAEKQLAEITDTLELKEKTSVLSSILDTAQAVARTNLSAQICLQANERIAALMPHNAIRVERVDRSLRLWGQEGGSVGETLSVAYAFLATLFRSTGHRLPFVVDSPANPLDYEVRANVAGLIPGLSHQFIAFTISSERECFLEPLEMAADYRVQYITLFRKGHAELEARAAKVALRNETQDGITVYDRGFFCDFQLEAENGGN